MDDQLDGLFLSRNMKLLLISVAYNYFSFVKLNFSWDAQKVIYLNLPPTPDSVQIQKLKYFYCNPFAVRFGEDQLGDIADIAT